MADKRSKVIVYNMVFRGIFDRNRSEKTWRDNILAVPSPVSDEDINGLAQRRLVEIKAKRGEAIVYRHDNAEQLEFESHGVMARTLIVPYGGGVVVCKLVV